MLKVYPKVKVRALEDDDCSKYPLHPFNYLTIPDSTPVKGVKHSSAVSTAKVPKSYVPRSITPPPSLPKSVKKSEKETDAKNPRIRASSIPRPRAVISSPDNDQILGSKNKMRLQQPSAMKNHNLAKIRQSERTSTRTSTTSQKLFRSGEVTNAETCTRTSKKFSSNVGGKVTNASDEKVQKGPGIDVRVPTVNISKGKPCFMIT